MQVPLVSDFYINLLKQATEMCLILKLRNMRESFCYRGPVAETRADQG